ncbi:hypothetical protein C0585_00750 [Candidatus Woesearchaeota archaeon]|nr:MAG: hypothetical protein C0585_00750 [Candidatus Woesearchaeota archaeon]
MGIDNIKKIIFDLFEKNDPFWKVHVLAVVDNSIRLAKRFDADVEVCEVSAWLHDIAKLEGTRENHHVIGSKRAEEILIDEGYDNVFIEKVKDCILYHSSDKKYVPRTLEEKIVACADATCHFDTFLEFAVKFLEKYDYDYDIVKNKIIIKFEKSLDKIMPELRDEYEKRFEAVKLVLGKD